LFREPQADQVRINKGLYAPRIMLEFEVIDGIAALVRSGKRDLTDIQSSTRNVYPREAYAMKRTSYATGCAPTLAF
jgi:hypothetical protein